MASLRPGRCYRRHERPNTRQSIRVPRKGYVKGVPRPKIAEFELGTRGKYKNSVFLVSQRNVQIRHNALESGRIMAIQWMDKNLSKGSAYFFRVRVYPHHVLRENALATGAGADRFQQGMRMSFGKPVGTAARVYTGQRIMELKVNDQDIAAAKAALKKASYKMPTPCRIITEPAD